MRGSVMGLSDPTALKCLSLLKERPIGVGNQGTARRLGMA
jgi:hypothetical protein